MPPVKKCDMDSQPPRKLEDVLFPEPALATKEETPQRIIRLLSWDKKINAGMIHVEDDRTSDVYYVRRLESVTPTFCFQKVKPTEDGLSLPFPYSVHIYTTKRHTSTTIEGVCHCQGYKVRKTCRHVDAAITMVNEYNV